MSEYKRTALVLGAGGFIGSHMVKRLRAEGYWVRGVDLKHTEFSKSEAHEFVEGDLRDVRFVRSCIQFKGYPGNFNANVPYQYIQPFDEIYQFAADMGGAGYIFTGENDADIMHNSASINLNVLEEVRKLNETFDGEVKEWTEANRPKLDQPTKIFYSSSACMYPEYAQEETDNPGLKENDAYPAAPDSEYGWEKLFSERLYFSYNRNHGIPVRVARYHNIFGPEGTWEGGREKAPVLQSAVKSLTSRSRVEQSRCGESIKDYVELEERIIAWIKEYADNNGIKALVIGVSGGIDSAVVSTLCARTGIPTYVLSMPLNSSSTNDNFQIHIPLILRTITIM